MRFVFAGLVLAMAPVSQANADEWSDADAVRGGHVAVYETTASGVTARFHYPRGWRLVEMADATTHQRYGDLQVEGTPQCGVAIIALAAPVSPSDLRDQVAATIQQDATRELSIAITHSFNGVDGVQYFYNERTADPFAPRARHAAFAIPHGSTVVTLDCSVGAVPNERELGETMARYQPVFLAISQTLSAR